jgi:hypothetical protein
VSGIDDLLADAAIPTSSGGEAGVAAGLRRLALAAAAAPYGAARPGAATRLTRLREARAHLDALSRWVIGTPAAPAVVRRLVDEPPADGYAALVFGCLLHLTGHPESAQFWWQLAAGAESPAAAHCLHLHHLHRGELREARHWAGQAAAALAVAASGDGATPPRTPPPSGYLAVLTAFTRWAAKRAPALSPEPLEPEVDRLAARDRGIVTGPDRRLADRLCQALGVTPPGGPGFGRAVPGGGPV